MTTTTFPTNDDNGNDDDAGYGFFIGKLARPLASRGK